MTRPSLEFSWADLAERRVATPLVIKHLDVIEQGLLRVGVALEALTLFALHVENQLSITALS